MKLATLKNNSRDGELVVVSCDLSQCVSAADIAPTMQLALDNWVETSPKLQAIYDLLNQKTLQDSKPFHQTECESPLPRAYQWADGSAYLNHVELVRKARGAEIPDSFWHDPLMYQGGSDSFIGPRDDLPLEAEAWGIDFEAEIVVITDDVPMGVSSSSALQHIKLILLVNDVSLRNLIPAELAKGFGFFQSKASSSFSPVCVTPDELVGSWSNGKLHRVLNVDYNDDPFGRANAGEEMTFSFNDLIAHAAKSRPLCAGTLVGSGTVSNKLDDGPGLPVSEGGRGYSCIAEIRMIETIKTGKPITEFMRFGDRIKIEVLDDDGQSIFGRIDQQLIQYKP